MFFQKQHGPEPPQRVKGSQIPFPVPVGNRDGVLSIMRILENKKVSNLCVLFYAVCHQYKKIRLSLVDYILCVFYLRCEILSFLLHLRAAAPLQNEIKKTLIFKHDFVRGLR